MNKEHKPILDPRTFSKSWKPKYLTRFTLYYQCAARDGEFVLNAIQAGETICNNDFLDTPSKLTDLRMTCSNDAIELERGSGVASIKLSGLIRATLQFDLVLGHEEIEDMTINLEKFIHINKIEYVLNDRGEIKHQYVILHFNDFDSDHLPSGFDINNNPVFVEPLKPFKGFRKGDRF